MPEVNVFIPFPPSSLDDPVDEFLYVYFLTRRLRARLLVLKLSAPERTGRLARRVTIEPRPFANGATVRWRTPYASWVDFRDPHFFALAENVRDLTLAWAKRETATPSFRLAIDNHLRSVTARRRARSWRVFYARTRAVRRVLRPVVGLLRFFFRALPGP